MAPGPVITKEDFPEDFFPGMPDETTSVPYQAGESWHDPLVPQAMVPLRKARERVEKALILKALEMTDGQRARAAELLEIKPRTLRQKMSDYGIAFRRKRKRAAAKSMD